MVDTKNATIRLEKKYLDYLEPYGSVNQGVKEVIDKLQTLQKLSANELRGKFTPSEWSFFAASLNGTLADESIRYSTECLIYHCEDSEKYESQASQWGVDLQALYKKIRNLSCAQLDSLYKRVEDFWDNQNGTGIDLDVWAKF